MDNGKKPTIVTGVVGYDCHIVGNIILSHALREAGFKVINLGIETTPEEFIAAAIETNASAILISSLYGQAQLDCELLKEKCIEAGLKDIKLYIGGNLVIGKGKWDEVEKIFKDMGFDRVYPPGIKPQQAIEDLKRDLKIRN